MKTAKHKRIVILTVALLFVVVFVCVFLQIQEMELVSGEQEAEDVYLVSTLDDFEDLVRRIRAGETEIDVRLVADISFNDTSDFENWAQAPPEYECPAMITKYGGNFDGGGYALVGYAARHPVFGELMEGGSISALNIRASYIETLYEDRYIPEEGENAEAHVNVASGLCGYNYGEIADCTVEAVVLGDGTASGIVAYNGGVVRDCSFSGTVEAGRCILRPEESLDIDRPRWLAGGVVANNYKSGTVSGCTNDGEIVLYTGGEKTWRNGYQNTIQMESCAGGLAGKNNGLMESCLNQGNVSCARVAGGIAGANSGTIKDCGNRGSILLLPEDEAIKMEYRDGEERAAAGISGYNTGSISDSYNAGAVRMEDGWGNGKEDGYVYGISQNLSILFDAGGGCHNCYFLAGQTDQKYRYSGCYKLSATEMDEIDAYLHGDQSLQDIEGYCELYTENNLAGTDDQDYIRLSVGPDQDILYQVQDGDSLWGIAEDFYGDGLYYDELIVPKQGDVILPGQEIVVPHLEYYLLRALDERAFGGVEIMGEADEDSGIASAFAKKESAGWLYVYYLAETAGDYGMSVITPTQAESDTWLKTGEEPAIFPSCIFFQVTANDDGDLFAGDWKAAQESIRQSAEHYLGSDCWGLRFYRYMLDNGEHLYGYTFHCYAHQPGMEEKQTLDCAVYYRMREGLLAEFIGVEEHRAESDLSAAVRYLAAIVAQEIDVSERPLYDSDKYLGRECWDFPALHNPFAIMK